jgi:hypothetical protein
MADIDELCANCERPFEGAVEIIKTSFRGTPILLLKDTSDRNWVWCRGCGEAVCKPCYKLPQIDFCNRCLEYVRKVSLEFPLTAVFTISLSSLRIWQKAAGNHNDIQPKGGIH